MDRLSELYLIFNFTFAQALGDNAHPPRAVSAQFSRQFFPTVYMISIISSSGISW